MKWIIFIIIFFLGFYIFNSKQNDKIMLQSSTKILAFGDSLTYGYGASKDHSYPSQLAKLLNVEVINEGVSGEVSEEGLKRFIKTFNKVNPNILILCHGGNDILRKYDLKKTKENIKHMINFAKDKHSRVILIGVPNWNNFFGISTEKIYYELAEELDIELEDKILKKIMYDNTLKSDQIHPNDKGYEIMAIALKKIILKE